MARVIEQFMWGYQSPFRTSLNVLAEGALSGIGTAAAPKCLLVGFANADDARQVVCIEPEHGPFVQADLANVDARAQELYEAHPDRTMLHTHPGVHAQRQAGIKDDMRGQALCEALTTSPGGAGLTFFAGTGVIVNNYVIYPVLSVLTSRWSSLPALSTTERNRIAVQRSLPFAAVDQVLRSASRALRQKDPPSDIRETPTDVIREAANSLGDSVAQALLGQFMGGGLKDSLDAVAAQPYEGRAGAGSVLLARPSHPHVDVVVSFNRPVPVRSTRGFRKVLEMSTPGLALLCDGADVYGMGWLTSDFEPQAEDAFHVTVVGRGSWELVAPGGTDSPTKPLLRVDNGQATLPKQRLSKEKFLDTVERLFPTAPDGSADHLWDLAQACAGQAHGTMLVVHPDASAEGQRMHPQALTISPARPPADALLAMTSIDGAVLVAPDGQCHAVGVILDGTATGTGDPARGARYNSAVRYLAGQGDGALIIIVSEDGMINLLPDLRPRRKQADVKRAVQQLKAASQGTPNYEAFYGLNRHIEALEFYLDQAQCDAVNAARQAVEDHRWRKNSLRMLFEQVLPNPAMNDTFWL